MYVIKYDWPIFFLRKRSISIDDFRALFIKQCFVFKASNITSQHERNSFSKIEPQSA